MKRKTIIYMLVIVELMMGSMTSVGSVNIKENEEWETMILITETGGYCDYIIIGEKLDASEMVDIYDVPKCPSHPDPFIRSYIYHAGMQFPYQYLWFEYRNANLKMHKEYQLNILCVVSDSTEITITWNKADFRDSGYRRVTLCDSAGTSLVNMKAKNTYTYRSDAYSFNIFVIKTEHYQATMRTYVQ